MLFEPRPCEGFEIIVPCDESDSEAFYSLDGNSRSAGWRPVKVRRTRSDQRHDMKASDFPWILSCALGMRRRAVDVLRGVLERSGEVLPLETDDDVELFTFNARVVDALDAEKSDLMRFPQSQRIMRIKKAVLRASAVRGLDVFRLPFRSTPTYVSERFVELVEGAKLVGLKFNEVTVDDA